MISKNGKCINKSMEEKKTFLESVKGLFKTDKTKSPNKITPTTNTLTTPNLEGSLTNFNSLAYGIYEDGVNNNIFNYDTIFGGGKNIRFDFLQKQENLITEYRRISNRPEVESAIDEIINEMFYITGGDTPFNLNFKTGHKITEDTQDKFFKCFNKIIQLMGGYDNMPSIGRRFYIDGQLNLLVIYNQENLKQGIISLENLSPIGLFRDTEKGTWQYYDVASIDAYSEEEDILKTEYQPEEVAHINSGKFSNGAILSDLNSVIKIVNQVQSLEDMLVPIRFSRSRSRRVFNIDVGDLPHSKAKEALHSIVEEIKYKQFYDVEKGTISNNASISALTEDYYFFKRGETKGTTIETFDEQGNAGDIEDIKHMTNKLYNALKVPIARLTGDNEGKFDFTGTQTEASEVKFFSFVRSKRKAFNKLLLQLLKLQFVTTTGINPDKYDEIYGNYLDIIWTQDNNFVERQRMNILKERLELYEDYKEYIGDIFSKRWAMQNILKLSDMEIDAMQDEIIKEGMIEEDLLQEPSAEDSPDIPKRPSMGGRGSMGGDDDMPPEPRDTTMMDREPEE